jgi:hypothetical protein
MPDSSREDIALFAIRYYSFNKLSEDRIQKTEGSINRQNTEDRRQNKEENKNSRKLDRHVGFVLFILYYVSCLLNSTLWRGQSHGEWTVGENEPAPEKRQGSIQGI